MNATQWRIMFGALLAGMAGMGAHPTGAAETNLLEQLDQKVRILERKLEIADEAAAAKAKDTPVLTAGKEGFALSAPDKSYQFKLRGYLQTDGRFFVDDNERKAVDTFAVRRARVIFDGTLGKPFEYRVAPDFGGGKAELQDGYLDYKRSSLLNVRFGRTKVPFGIERLQSSSETLFNEAGLSTALTPNYDIGVMPYGSVGAGTMEYALGVFNGGPDGASSDADTNDGKDLAARIVVTPLKNSALTALSGLSFGFAGTVGKQGGTAASPGLPSIRSSGQQNIFSYKTSTNTADVAFADGNRTRISPQFYYTVGSFGLLGEYVISEQEVANGKGSDTVKNEAWQVAASYVLTGESPSLKGVKPLKPFNPAAGNWGAFELAARAGGLEVDDAAFAGGYADRKKSVSAASNIGVGINWYLTGHAKFVVDYEHTTFDDGDAAGDRPDEQVVIARAQASW
jgi:phosphate-selective porin OprO/OprP